MSDLKPIKGGTTITLRFTPKINGVPMTAAQRAGITITAKFVLATNPDVSGAVSGAISTDSVITPPPCCPIDPVGWFRVLEDFDQSGTCTVMMTALETYNMSIKLPGGMVRYRLMLEVKTPTTTTGEEYGQDLIINVVRWATTPPSES